MLRPLFSGIFLSRLRNISQLYNVRGIRVGGYEPGQECQLEIIRGIIQPVIYLTSMSTAYLVQFLLTLGITFYLMSLARRGNQRAANSPATGKLVGLLITTAVFMGLNTLAVSLAPRGRFFAIYLAYPTAALAVFFLARFAYHFPDLPDRQKTEARLAMWGALIVFAWEVWDMIRRFAIFGEGHLVPKSALTGMILAGEVVWVLFVLVRRAIGYRRTLRALVAANEPADSVRRQARATGRFLSVFLLYFFVLLLEIIASENWQLRPATYQANAIVGLLGIAYFVTIYLDYLSETVSLVAKATVGSLVFLLSILGSLSFFLQPVFWDTFPTSGLVHDQQRLRFAPGTSGGYDVESLPFDFESSFGARLDLADNRAQVQKLAFTFPFFQDTWEEVHVSDNGLLALGNQPLSVRDSALFWKTAPAIYALTADLDASAAEPAGVYIRSTSDEFLVTWYRLPEKQFPDELYTFQLGLYPDGRIEVAFQDLPSPQQVGFRALDANYLWQTGVIPGPAGEGLRQIHLSGELPYSGPDGYGIVDSGYLYYRARLHRFILPLVFVQVGGILLVILGYPFFLRVNLSRPLRALLEGVQQVNEGNLEVEVPSFYNDEIGFLAGSFNRMADTLRKTQADLLHANQELESRWHEDNTALQESQHLSDSIIQNIPEGLIIADKDRNIVYVNPAVSKIFGYQPDELLGRHEETLIAPEYHAEIDKVQRLRQEGISSQFEADIVHRDGSKQRAFIIGVPRYVQGIFGGTMAIIIPITAQVEIEKALREQQALAVALRATTAALTSNLSLEETVQQVLVNVQVAIPHDSANVMLLEAEAAHLLEARYFDSQADTEHHQHERIPLERMATLRQMVETGEPVLIEDTRTDPRWTHITGQDQTLAFLGAPLLLHGNVIGFINMGGMQAGKFTRLHADHLKAFADQASIAIENARLRQQEQHLAVFQDRQRLARDLHDGVTQTLYSVNLMAEVIPDLWEQDAQAAQKKLLEMQKLTHNALGELRAMLIELKPEQVLETELGILLEQLGKTASLRTGAELFHRVDGTSRLLPPTAQMALYRIAQEALQNIVRHAVPDQIHTTLRYQPQQVSLCIQDDGQGFILEDVPPGHFGLRIMHERAQEIGATLQISSQVDQGVTVSVLWVSAEMR